MISQSILVQVGRAEIARPGERLVTRGLGSCVAIVLHDPKVRIAGMAHVLLPESGRGLAGHPAKFADTAVPYLVEALEREGASRARLVARLVGGASMFGTLLSQSSLHTGERNLLAARDALERADIRVVGEEVGKEHGRTVYFDPVQGRAVVTSYQHEEVVL